MVIVAGKDLSYLKQKVDQNVRKRIRLCTHCSIDDKTQEMFIVLPRDSYIRPHKHLGKSEAMSAIEGAADIIFFDDDGNLTEIFRISSSKKQGTFYYRINKAVFHTVVVRSKYFIFHEVTSGPYKKEQSAPASWAPSEEKNEVGREYLQKAIKSFRKKDEGELV